MLGFIKDRGVVINYEDHDEPHATTREFFGFTFLNKDSWIATEGNQDRNKFTRGTNTVMVADPDAYDDLGTGIEPDKFNVFIQTPAISLANAVAYITKPVLPSAWESL